MESTSSEETTTSQSFWRNLVTCPVCGGALPDVRQCAHCGRTYGEDRGTPVLMSADARRTVSYTFTADRSAPPPERLAKWLNEPPIDTTSPELPYHMDAAHAHLLEQLPRGLRVLEIGCGGGQCRPWFQGRGFEYVGVDVSKTRVFDWLQRWGGPDMLCDTHFLPFRDRSFDAVYCAAVTEHLASPQLAAQEIFRVLKPGGHYLGNCSFLEPWHDNSFYHMTPLGAGELLTTAGFEVQNIWPSRGYSGYRSLTAMGFRPPLRVLKHVGQLAYGVYRLQNRMQAAVRKLRHRAEVPDIFNRAKVAGATDWIARKAGS